MLRVLIVDDESTFVAATEKLLEQRGFEVASALDLQTARRYLSTQLPDVLLLDIVLPDGSGLDLIQEIDPDAKTRIVVMTAHPTLDIAIDSLRARVADFLIKPVDVQHLLSSLKAIERAQTQTRPIKPSAGFEPAFEQFVGNSDAMLSLYKLIDRVAPSNASVLIRGASGTGKELVAQAIHARSERRDKPHLSINCGAVSVELIGSELFGHERGAFTGANRQHLGYFERANGGTLFLDEVTEMPLEQQVKLLRVLETGKLTRLGGDQEIAVDVRIVAATNRDPATAIREGHLREDLYFRLAVFPIQIPSLNERDGDIKLLAEFFLNHLNRDSKTNKRFAPGTKDWLERQRWPGNVRELKNAMQRAFLLADDSIAREHFPEQLSNPISPPTTSSTVQPVGKDGDLRFSVGQTPIDEAERQLIYATLKHYKDNKSKTADALGISLKTLYNRLKQYEEEGRTPRDND